MTENDSAVNTPDREYDICNLQPCPLSKGGSVTAIGVDFRAQQCLKYNEVPYQGEQISWSPEFDPEAPCTLFCKSSSDPELIVKMDDKVSFHHFCI